MQRFSRNDDSPESQELRLMFESATEALKTANEWQRVSVGTFVNDMSATFHANFPRTEHFRLVTDQRRIEYINSIEKLAEELRQIDVHAGLGVLLFSWWLRSIALHDVALELAIGIELEALGKLATKNPV